MDRETEKAAFASAVRTTSRWTSISNTNKEQVNLAVNLASHKWRLSPMVTGELEMEIKDTIKHKH